MEKIYNPVSVMRRYFSLGNMLFLASVFIMGWLAGLLTFVLLLSKFVH